ncbi:MAG: DNA-binding response regulator [Chloroflexi bacterium]|nr:MAG: DNA-binding response regulator [Chloroflexota bacterium]
MATNRIVIVDDDPVTAKVLRFVLEDEGYDTVSVSRGSQVFAEVIGRETHLVILDVNLPDIHGFDLCKELRARRYNGPIIFLTGRRDIADKLEGFRIGADDYIVKPFEPLELVARVGSVIRRFYRSDQQSLGSVLRVGDAELSIGDLTYSSAEVEPVLLTPTEMRILECLMRNHRIIISRETLIERVWGYEFIGDTNRVDVYIRRVRRKIEPDPAHPRYLHTVRGVGYVFRVDSDDEFGLAADDAALDAPVSSSNGTSGVASLGNGSL